MQPLIFHVAVLYTCGVNKYTQFCTDWRADKYYTHIETGVNEYRIHTDLRKWYRLGAGPGFPGHEHKERHR